LSFLNYTDIYLLACLLIYFFSKNVVHEIMKMIYVANTYDVVEEGKRYFTIHIRVSSKNIHRVTVT